MDEQSVEKPSADDALAKLRAAHAARKARRSFKRLPSLKGDLADSPTPSTETNPTDEKRTEKMAKDEEKVPAHQPSGELEELRTALATANVEIASMRRNHMANVKKITAERDMFALQLAQEQAEAPPESVRGIEDLRAQLKATRMRNANLEEENVQLRHERKELALQATASKTISAASTGYEKVVTDLIDVKLKCATLNDEKEALSRESRNLKTDNEALSEANRLLEKSRADWVLKCAELEKKLQLAQEEMERLRLAVKIPITDSSTLIEESAPHVHSAHNESMSQNSELQELDL